MGVASVFIAYQGVYDVYLHTLELSRLSGFNAQTVVAFIIYTVHLFVNWLWTPMFFGAEKFAGVSF